MTKLKTIRIRKGLKPYRTLGCPMTRSQSVKCLRFCQPDRAGIGPCGRHAPHSIKSQIQLAIEAHNNRRAEEALAAG